MGVVQSHHVCFLSFESPHRRKVASTRLFEDRSGAQVADVELSRSVVVLWVSLTSLHCC